jgi:hypothetical protein
MNRRHFLKILCLGGLALAAGAPALLSCGIRRVVHARPGCFPGRITPPAPRAIRTHAPWAG